MNRYEVNETLINIESKEVIKVKCIYTDIEYYERFSYTCVNVENNDELKLSEMELRNKYRSLSDLDLEIGLKQHDRNVLDNELCELNLLKENMRDTLKIVNKKLNGDTKR